MSNDRKHLDDLPELPDAAELGKLPELPDEVEIPDLPDDALLESSEKPSPPARREPPRHPGDAPAPKPVEPAKPPVPAKRVAPSHPGGAVKPVAPAKPPVPKSPAVQSKPQDRVKDGPTITNKPAASSADASDSQAPPSTTAPAPAQPALAPGEKPPLRELDKAPTHLRLAAAIVAAGCLLPFMGAGGGWMALVAAKALALLAAFFWWKQAQHNWGPELKGFLGNLASMRLGPKPKEKKPSRRKSQTAAPVSLEHPFPTGLHILALLTLIGAIAFVMLDKTEGYTWFIALAEVGMLAWAAFTWVHIFSYERWGSFNPLFPLMFLGMLFAGISRVAFAFKLEGSTMLFALLGGAIVAAGGGLAAFTIVEAMMQAKKEGDRKKAEALEARKAARKAGASK